MQITLDLLACMPVGETYEDTYGSFLEIFKTVAENNDVVVKSPPKSWVPLLRYLGANVEGDQDHFYCDKFLQDPFGTFDYANLIGRQREYVEHAATLRPELVDSLWKSDMEWKTVGRLHSDMSILLFTRKCILDQY